MESSLAPLKDTHPLGTLPPTHEGSTAFRVWPTDAEGFSTRRVNRLQHDFHRHPLFQLDALQALAQELMPLSQCRFVRPGLTQGSAFVHADRHHDGRAIAEVFDRLEEPGSWIALYNVEAIPRYAHLLADIVDTVRPLIEAEEPGIFNINGFMFLSAPPSVTPFHIDRENNFWLQLHGRKTLNVWSPDDRTAVPAPAVEDFIVTGSLRDVRYEESLRARSFEFDTAPGDGVYFPSTSPHMTRSDPAWTRPGDGVSVSIGVTFYTSVTRQAARVHQLNRMLRQTGVTPMAPGASRVPDALRAPAGLAVGASRAVLQRAWRLSRAMPGGLPAMRKEWDRKVPPGSF